MDQLWESRKSNFVRCYIALCLFFSSSLFFWLHLKSLYSIMNLNTISLTWQARPTNLHKIIDLILDLVGSTCPLTLTPSSLHVVIQNSTYNPTFFCGKFSPFCEKKGPNNMVKGCFFLIPIFLSLGNYEITNFLGKFWQISSFLRRKSQYLDIRLQQATKIQHDLQFLYFSICLAKSSSGCFWQNVAIFGQRNWENFRNFCFPSVNLTKISNFLFIFSKLLISQKCKKMTALLQQCFFFPIFLCKQIIPGANSYFLILYHGFFGRNLAKFST